MMYRIDPLNSALQRFATSLLVIALVLLGGCRITDHSENDGEVNPQHISFPASGYEEVDTRNVPVLTFEQTHLDMGKIVQGNTIEHRFTFRNTGRTALVITDVRGSCGCTVSKDWPREPVPPGGTGGITVAFDSEGRSGRQDKTVTIVANTTPPSTVLTLTGEVLGPAGLVPVE
jgi:hypothetical protein